MAISTQILFLCLCCFVADSYFFNLDFYDGEDYYRIPVGLPEHFSIYPGMFDPPGGHVTSHRHHHHKRPFTSDATTAKLDTEKNFETTESTLDTTEDLEEDILVTQPYNVERNQDPSLKKSVKIDDDIKGPNEDNRSPQVNTLSIHDEPILSVKIPEDREKRTTELPKVGSAVPEEETINDSKNQNNQTDSGLNKNTDYIFIPVAAITSSDAILNSTPSDSLNTLTPMAGIDNGFNFNQGYPINGVVNVNPNYNNMNPNYVNPGPYGNQPILYGNNINPQYRLPNPGNGVNPNLYSVVPFPNTQGKNFQGVPNNNLYYLNNGNPNIVQPNSPPMYNLVPINNYPNNPGVNQPYNNQPNNVVPNYNQPINGLYTIPNNYVPINQPNNFIPANNNYGYIPINNNQPNNFVPLNNNNPNNYPINQPITVYPYNNQPNNFNGQPNNFVPINNQPNNFVPYNNVPNNVVPYQGNFIPFKDQTNDTTVNNDEPQPQPIVTLVALNEKEDTDDSTPKEAEQKDKESNEHEN